MSCIPYWRNPAFFSTMSYVVREVKKSLPDSKHALVSSNIFYWRYSTAYLALKSILLHLKCKEQAQATRQMHTQMNAHPLVTFQAMPLGPLAASIGNLPCARSVRRRRGRTAAKATMDAPYCQTAVSPKSWNKPQRAADAACAKKCQALKSCLPTLDRSC